MTGLPTRVKATFNSGKPPRQGTSLFSAPPPLICPRSAPEQNTSSAPVKMIDPTVTNANTFNQLTDPATLYPEPNLKLDVTWYGADFYGSSGHSGPKFDCTTAFPAIMASTDGVLWEPKNMRTILDGVNLNTLLYTQVQHLEARIDSLYAFLNNQYTPGPVDPP